MFLEDFIPLCSHYQEGIKTISFRTTSPKIEPENMQLQIENAYGNYDLFFSEEGLLIQSERFDKYKNKKTIYGYNNKNCLLTAMVLYSRKPILVYLSEFSYDEKGRIEIESCRSANRTGLNAITELIHYYSDNTEKIVESKCSDEDFENSVTIIYDEQNRRIEERSINENIKMCYWRRNEYDDNNFLKRQFILDDCGNTTSMFEYKPTPEKGTYPAYKRISAYSDYIVEFLFTYNEQGHWINQVVLVNDIPFIFH
jgi:hypothetical protein